MNFISDQPLVSIIIPCYKHEIFIERCLNSVAAQTYDNIEVVIVDDCSPDNSVVEIERIINSASWKTRFPNCTKFYPLKQNCGAHTAINYGISQASGSIISILNSDDMYHSERIQHIVTEMLNRNSEIVFSSLNCIDAKDRVITDYHPLGSRFVRQQQNIKHFPSIGFACLASNVAISTGNFVFTKALFERVGEFSSYRYCHDWDFLLRAIFYTEPFFLDLKLYYYRFHGKNSFESLQTIAIEETNKIIGDYIELVRYQWPENQLAPSPLNWPGLFELFLSWHGHSKLDISA